jgi:hypothetical protein
MSVAGHTHVNPDNFTSDYSLTDRDTSHQGKDSDTRRQIRRYPLSHSLTHFGGTQAARLLSNSFGADNLGISETSHNRTNKQTKRLRMRSQLNNISLHLFLAKKLIQPFLLYCFASNPHASHNASGTRLFKTRRHSKNFFK